MSVMHVYNPVGKPFNSGDKKHRTSERLGSLNGKMIGFIDAMKPNAGLFLKFLEGLIKAQNLIPSTDTVRKNITPNMAMAHELDPSVEGVVVAWGD